MITPERGARRAAAVRLGGLAVALVGIGIVTAAWGAGSVRSAVDGVADSGWSGVVAFVLLYALATVMLVPGSASTATAGLVYGTMGGAAVAVAGATLGASVAYGVARGIGRKPVEATMARRAAQIDAWVSGRQFQSMVVLRLLPVVPFNLFNYAAGLSPVRPRPYVAGTVVGLIPGALLVAGLGSSARQPTSPAFALLLVVAVVAAVSSGVVARRWVRR